MDANQTRRLIQTMLDKGDLMPETAEELQDYLADLDKGELNNEDAKYIEGLAQRLGFSKGGPAPANDDQDADEDDLDFDAADEDDDLAEAESRIADLESNLAAQQEMAEIAGAAVERAQTVIAGLRDAENADAEKLDALDTALTEAADALPRKA
jgi:uncharacterized coiled-coil protein SlyX